MIITRVDPHIYNNDEEQMKQEIYDKNPWTNEKIEKIFKFPNSKTINITFQQASLAKKVQADGLRCFYMSIPPHDIKQEIFYNITTCYKCYKIKDHVTKIAPKKKSTNYTQNVPGQTTHGGNANHQPRDASTVMVNIGQWQQNIV